MWVKCKQGCFSLSPWHAGPVLPNYSCFLFDHNPWMLLFPVSFIVPGVYYTTEYFQEEWVPTTIVSSTGLFLCSYIPVERLASLLQPYQSGTLLEVYNGTGETKHKGNTRITPTSVEEMKQPEWCSLAERLPAFFFTTAWDWVGHEGCSVEPWHAGPRVVFRELQSNLSCRQIVSKKEREAAQPGTSDPWH